MGRQTKQGIDYFPLDCSFDPKTELYLLEKEAVGLAVMITLWQFIYQDEGYYIENGKDLLLLVKKRINSDITEIESCINAMLERDIFCKSLHDKYGILTSKALQKRYFDAAKKKKSVRYIPNFILIDNINSYGNLKNVGINKKDSTGNATKEKEEEKEEVKEKENIFCTVPLKKGHGAFPVTLEMIEKYQDLYPGMEIPTALKYIAQWNDDNPAKRKTRTGVKSHITRFLNSLNDKNKFRRENGEQGNGRGHRKNIFLDELEKIN